MKKCYEDMGCELDLSPDDMRKRRVKYIDGVTKGLAQLKTDIENGTEVLPIPAVHKLRIFRWFWPYSKNFDAAIMQNMNFDSYMEHALIVHVNRLERTKQDATTARDTLRKVRELNEKHAADELGLKTGEECEVEVVMFDDSSMLRDTEEVCSSVCSSSICAYLPPSHDPTFNYAEHGFVFFGTSVTISTSEMSVKSVRKHCDVLLSTLKCSGESAQKARQALCHAQTAEASYIDAVAALIGWDFVAGVIGQNAVAGLSGRDSVKSDGGKSEHDLIASNAGIVRRLSEFHSHVCDAVQVAQLYAIQYDSLRDTASSVSYSCSKCRKERAMADIAHLRDLRKNLKMFSSDKWVCVLINQL